MLFILTLSFLLGVDSFVTCLSMGMCNAAMKRRRSFTFFGIIGLFHFFMPILGYSFALVFKSFLLPYGKYFSFAVFGFLGAKMIVEGIRSFLNKEGCCENSPSLLTFSSMLLLSFMLSIDTIVAGLSVPVLQIELPLLLVAFFFALFAFSMSIIGFYSGRYLSDRVGKFSNLIAGILMFLLAFKALSL